MSKQNAILLDAGAVLPTGSKVIKDDTVDSLTARTYRHPVLGDQVIVRLVPGMLGAAEDLSMEFLGFDKPGDIAPVGVIRQQALGFPAWALVHDPANGHHALALVKDIERLARMARSRTGAAKDGFNALGEKLARSVPHFLPTFYEEAGRAFLAADSSTYAATMFGKARDAESAFGLTIDEERQHAVFLEFALGGALTAKSLSAHARDLAGRSTPEQAYERFRRLCVERTMGGLPPYAAMHTDLRRLAKVAKLDQATADEQVLADLLSTPAIGRAPEAFWTAYRVPLARLAAGNPELRGKLLGMFPRNCDDAVWLSILDEAGALAALTAPAGDTAAEAAAADGPAGWLSRFARHRSGRRGRGDKYRMPQLLAFVETMASRLKSDGQPVTLCVEYRAVDLDLLDLCLANGVPVADPPDGARYQVSDWLSDETDGRRDLVALAGDERFLTALVESVESHLRPGWRGDKDPIATRVRPVVAVPGLRSAVAQWLEQLAGTVGDQGLPTLGQQLDRVGLLACAEGFAVNADAVRRIVRHDLGAVLGRTLRAGVLDEYGWPALEQAAEQLAGIGKPDESRLVTAQWPNLIARKGDQVLVVGAEQIELSHLMRIPANQRGWMNRLVLRYVDGQLLVCWDTGPDRALYWTGSPDDVHTVDDNAFDFGTDSSLPLPAGGRTAGGRPLRIGDRAERKGGRVISDGQTYWHEDTVDQKTVLREYDPATGEPGRVSLPAFFEAGTVDGEPLQLHASWLRPAPASSWPSPLGAGHGLLGWRVRELPGDRLHGSSVDGGKLTIAADVVRDGSLQGMVRFPGSDTGYAVFRTQRWRDQALTLVTEDGFVFGRYQLEGEATSYALGTPLLPRLPYWHFLRPRDEAGSSALRALTDERAGSLLARTVGPDGEPLGHEDLLLSVRELVPQVSHAGLATGISGVVAQAGKLSHQLRQLAAVLDGLPSTFDTIAEAPAQPSGDSTDSLLVAALRGLMPYCYTRGNSAVELVRAAGVLLAGEGDFAWETVAHADDDWLDVLGVLPAAMLRAAAPLTEPAQREALLRLLTAAADSGLLLAGSRLREVELVADRALTVKEHEVIRIGDRRLLVLDTDEDDREVSGLEFDPAGRFGELPGYKITKQTVHDIGRYDAATVTSFVALVREHGGPPWRPELARQLSEQAGVSLAEATILLAGLPPVELDDSALAASADIAGELDDEELATALGLTELGPADYAAALPAREKQARVQPWQALGLPDLQTAKTAVGRWHALGSRLDLAAMLGRLLPADLDELWTSGPALAAAAAEWTGRHGQRTPVRDDLIVEISRSFRHLPMSASELIHGIANPLTCRWLAGPVSGMDDDDVLVALTKALPWLVYHLPADDPIRSTLTVTVERIKARLADPATSVHIGYISEEKVAKLASWLGSTAVEGPAGLELGAVLLPPDTGWRVVHVRPGLLTGPDDPILGVLSARLDSSMDGALAALRTLLGDQLAALVSYEMPAHLADFASDPSRSAPELVTQVAERFGLSPDAAVVYLQLLALPDPTDRNVAGWTGWKPARLKAARAELSATDLVVEAKRARAGRTLFLPGGWSALKAPHLPLERWKLPLLIGGEAGITQFAIVIPIAPPPRLFELAWTRVCGDDAPRFDELVTERRR